MMRAVLFLTMTALAFAAGSPASATPKVVASKAASASKAAVGLAGKAAKPRVAGEKICKKNELRLQPVCKAGPNCAALCLPKPSRAGGLCPDGLSWKKLACPSKARCLLGGRCVGKAPAKPVTKVPAAASGKQPGAKAVRLAKVIHAPVKCGVGRVPTQVMCFRAPCPTLCLPARLDPSLKASPRVRPL